MKNEDSSFRRSNAETFKSTMTDEQKELFEKDTDCVREYQTITDCLICQNSFKPGAGMMFEFMEESSDRPRLVLVLNLGTSTLFPSAQVVWKLVLTASVQVS